MNFRLDIVTLVHFDTAQHSRGFYERHGFVVERYTQDGYDPGIDPIDLTLRLTPERCRAIRDLLAEASPGPR